MDVSRAADLFSFFTPVISWRCRDGAAELPGQKFGGTDRVGADSIRPPPLQIFEQNHIGPEM